MYLKRLLALLCSLALVFCLLPSTAFAEGGNGNIDGGGGSMGQGTSSNFWNPGNDGVRITVVDADSGTAISSPVDFSNRVQKNSVLHFGKVNKLQYLGGTALSLQSGVAYSCIKPTQSMPTIVSSKGQSNIEAIKRYFCSEYACQMVAQAAGVDYERMIAGDYKLLIPYSRHHLPGQRYSHPGRRQPGGLGQMAHALHSTVGNHHGFRQRGLYRTRYLCCGDRGLERTYPSRSDSNGYQPRLHRALTPQ